MSNNYGRFLRHILFNKVYTRTAMNFIYSSPNLATRYLQRAIENKHIREYEYKERERTMHVTRFYTLTQKGLNYIFQNDPIISKWCDGEKTKNIIVLNPGDRRTEVKFRMSLETLCLTIAQAASAYIPIENYTERFFDKPKQEESDEIKNPIYADKIIAEQLSPETFDELFDQSNCSNEIVYHTGRYFKVAAGDGSSLASAQDFLGGRYTGIIDSVKKSVLMYSAPMFGFRWSKYIVQKELAPYRIWAIKNGMMSAEQLNRSGKCGAMIVKSVPQFKNLFLNHDAIPQKGETFGGAFDHMYIIPTTSDGAKHLHWIMTTDDEEMNQEIIKDAISSSEYFESHKASKNLFPIVDAEEHRTYLGFQLDGKTMWKLREAAVALPNEVFVVLCYEWQEPYYKAVMPENVKIITFEIA